jgi:hypothetical protein
MDVLPVVFASHKPYYFGAVPAQHLLEDPDVDSAQPGCFTCAIGCAGLTSLTPRPVLPG